MSNALKIWLIVAASLVLAGGLLFVGVMSAVKWDFSKLVTRSLVTDTHEIQEEFQHITIKTDTADVRLLPSEDGVARVVCRAYEEMRHTVSVLDGTLVIETEDTRAWYDHIGIFAGGDEIKVYLPAKVYGSFSLKASTGDVLVASELALTTADVAVSTGDVHFKASATETIKIKTDTGWILMSDVIAKNAELTVGTGSVTMSDTTFTEDLSVTCTTGDVRLLNVTCRDLTSTANTGDLDMKDVLANGAFLLKRTTGDVDMERCDAAEIYVTTGTGDVEGSLLSEKIFVVKTSTGDVEVPRSASGGICEITTSTGDIEIELCD